MRGSRIALLATALAGTVIVSAVLGIERHRAMRTAARANLSLRDLTKAQADYAKAYGGYSSSLGELGPSPEGSEPGPSAAGLITDELASGRHYGYRFEYKPGPKDEKGRITGYAICAYPAQRYWIRGEPPNFSADHTGVVRYSLEDRCPGPTDAEVPR